MLGSESPGCNFISFTRVLDREAGQAKLYIDGQLVNQGSIGDLGSLDTNLPFTLGFGVGGSNDHFEGLID